MSSAPPVKRHRIKRAGEKRRDAADEDRSNEASEEDNRDDMSDVGSLLSVNASNSAASTTTSSPRMGPPAGLPPFGGSSAPPNSASAASGQGPNGARKLGQRVGELSVGDVSDRGLDSPTYDGDVESSSTIGGTPVHSQFHHHSHSSHHQRRASSPTPGGESGESSNSLSLNTGASANNGPATARGEPSSSATPFGRAPTPKASRASLKDDYAQGQPKRADCFIPSDVPVQPSEALRNPMRDTPKSAERVPPKMYERPAERSVDDIRGFVQRAIDGRGDEDGISRWWKTRPPPEDRPVRIYADGVYDLFHFGHALQLRQAKLSFPRVHLLVGVCSDQLCAESKSRPAMTHAERIEALRHCRWADEIIPDAPWVVDKAFVEKYNIDYLAHDEEVYPSKDHEDVYAFAKESGIFLPTRRTPAISTSDLLERIVRGYRDGFFDSKLEKNGHPELLAADVDWDSSASVERRERRKKKALEKHSQVQQLGEALGQALESGKALQLELSPPSGKKLQLQVSPP